MADCLTRLFALAMTSHVLRRGVLSRTSSTPPGRHRDAMTTQGTVRGYYEPHPPHYAYLGIPYARPPTRYARYKAPEPPTPWSGIFEAIHRVKCPQPDGSGEENCLVISVFAPEYATAQPVIVHFHGGGFQRGWSFYNAPTRFLEQGFIFVTFNYRLGALGFLCLGLQEIPGNAGLRDQVAALYWVNRNIENFGGNPLDVTCYGTGSGASSIELLLFSGLTKDLFHKVIMESGSVLSPSSITYEPVLNAYNFAKYLGYKFDSDIEALQKFYYEVSYEKTINSSKLFLPCIETHDVSHLSYNMLEKDPRDYLQNGKYQRVPMMIIYTNAEEISTLTNNIHQFNEKPENFESLLPNNLIFDNEYLRRTVAQLVKDFYFNELELSKNVFQSYVNYVNDILMEYPVVKSAVHHAQNNNIVFLMKYAYKGSQSNNKYKNVPGAEYGDLLQHIFNINYRQDYDEIIAKRLTTIWTNFIKLGDPTPITTLLIPEIWQPMNQHLVDNKIILHNIPCLMFTKTMRNVLLTDQQFVFWDYIYDKFYIN